MFIVIRKENELIVYIYEEFYDNVNAFEIKN